MKLFERKIEIDVDLQGKSIQEVMNLPVKAEVGMSDHYLAELYNENHIQIRVKSDQGYGGVHDFKYKAAKNRLTIWSRYPPTSFLDYIIVFLPASGLFIESDNPTTKKVCWGMIIIAFIYCTLLLSIGIRQQSKEIEREMVFRINYLNGVMN